MDVHLSSNEILQFCEKYPNFNIESLVLEYIRNVNSLNSQGVSLPELKSVLTSVLQDSSLCRDIVDDVSKEFRTHRDKETETFKEIIKTQPNDLVLALRDAVSGSSLVVSETNALFKDYTSSFKNSSVKGRNTEIKTVMQLDTVFPKHDVIHVPSSKQKGKMDIILSLKGKPDISIDTKNYNKTVPKAEVAKFESDMTIGQTHGIMISTNSKIAGKPNFTIDIIQGKVAVYLSNTHNEIDCVQLAVDIIYSMDSILQDSDSKSVSQDSINSIQGIVKRDMQRIDKVRANLIQCLDELKEMTLARVCELLT